MTLILVAIGWMFGLVVGDWLRLPLPLGVLLALGGAVLVGLWRNTGRGQQAGIVLLALGCGVGRMALAQPTFGPQHIIHLLDQSVRLEGVIADEPRWTPDKQTFTLQIQRVEATLPGPTALISTQRNPVREAKGLVLVELPPEPPHRLGERLLISGTLVKPRSGRGFDYAGYLARRGIWATLKHPVVETTVAPAASLRQTLLDLKEAARRRIVRLVPEPQASLLVGILLGIRSDVAPSVWDAFNRTGTSHILVISGWNITILVVALLWIGTRLRWRRSISTGAALLVVLLYVLFVGPSPSVVRAAIMGAIVALALPLGRRADAWTALAVACLLMTAINPQTLWDLGFELSAVATASLFAWGRMIERPVRWLLHGRWMGWMIEPLTATLAAQIWTLPLILYHFGNLSLVAPLANVLLLPIVPLAMAAGAALCALALLWRPLGWLMLPLAWLPLTWLVGVARWLASWRWAAMTLPPFPAWIIVLMYGATLGLWVVGARRWAKGNGQKGNGRREMGSRQDEQDVSSAQRNSDF